MRNLHIIEFAMHTHPPNDEAGLITHDLHACISILEVIARPEGVETSAPHAQASLSLHTDSRSSSPPPPPPTPTHPLRFENQLFGLQATVLNNSSIFYKCIFNKAFFFLAVISA